MRPLLLLAVLISTSWLPCPAAEVSRARQLMGTLCLAEANGPDSAQLSGALESALDEIARLELVMSSWRDDSEVSRLNRATDAFPCSRDLFAVIDSARAFAGLTEGAFDPTVDPLIEAWDLRGEGRIPAPDALRAALENVGWTRIQVDPPASAVRLVPGTRLDLGAIGKGFALDRAVAALRERGVSSALLNLGGEIAVLGSRAVEIAAPDRRLRPAIRLQVRDAGVSTSSQSERGFDSGGRRYGHVLDPRTGSPVATHASVTVVARSGTRADAFATALLVMGRQGAAAWCRDHPEIGVLWLEPNRGRIDAWAWNMVSARAVAGAAVRWRTSIPSGTPS